MRWVSAGYGYEYDEPPLPPHEAEQLRLQKTIIALGEGVCPSTSVPLLSPNPPYRTLSKNSLD